MVCVLVSVLALWQAVCVFGQVPAYDLPTPEQVVQKFSVLASSGRLWLHVSTTLEEAAIGFVVAFWVALILGYPLGKSRTLASVIAPYIAAIQAVPIIAVGPLLFLWIGSGLQTKVIICTLIVFFPMLVNVVVGLQTIDPDLIGAAQTMGAGRWQTLRHVEIPLAMHNILGAVKLGLSLAMTGALVSEFIGADAGLGYLMTLARSNLDPAMLFVAVFTMALIAFTGYAVVTIVELIFVDW